MKRTALLAALAMLQIASATADPLQLDVRPIESFVFSGSDAEDAPLHFIGGLQLLSDNAAFGGLSGIDMLDAETAFLISDSGAFVRARLVRDEDHRLVGLADAVIGGLFPDGDGSKRRGDAEDIAFDPIDPARGVLVRERQANAMLAFEMVDGRPDNFEPKRVGAEDRMLRSNRGLESVAYASPASRLAGSIVTIAERPPRGEADIPAWIVGAGSFSIVRHDDFDVSSARFLPNGDLLILERRQYFGWGMRLRRIAGAEVAVGARVDGDYLLEAGRLSGIDNMEGLAIHLDDTGRTILTIVSDDNYSILQRTLILQFALAED